jgi:hypothetical protein
MDVTYRSEARLPDRLAYHFDVSTSKPTGLEDSFRAGPTHVSQADPAQIGAPLFGKRWLTGEGCCDTITSHRGAIFPIDGTFHAPERFAIDWVQVGKNGRLYEGPKDKLSSYPYYGAKIRSVAAGRVVGTRDTEPEQIPGQFPNGVAPNDFGGNYVVVDIGDGRYAYYAHLQKGPKASWSSPEIRFARERSSASWATLATLTPPTCTSWSSTGSRHSSRMPCRSRSTGSAPGASSPTTMPSWAAPPQR